MGAETNAATTTETAEETKQAQAPVVDGEGANEGATTTQTEPKQDNKQQSTRTLMLTRLSPSVSRSGKSSKPQRLRKLQNWPR